MTTEREKRIRDVKALEAHGYNLHRDNAIRANDGSETPKHLHAKTATAQVLWNAGYRVDSEVPLESDTTNYLDVLGYGCVGRNPIGIELETGLDDETKQEYRNRYFVDAMQELYCVDVSTLDNNILKMQETVADKLGL